MITEGKIIEKICLADEFCTLYGKLIKYPRDKAYFSLFKALGYSS